MNDLISRLAERLSPKEMEELSALLVLEAGETLAIVVCDEHGQEEVSRRIIKLSANDSDDLALLQGLGVVREIIFDL